MSKTKLVTKNPQKNPKTFNDWLSSMPGSYSNVAVGQMNNRAIKLSEEAKSRSERDDTQRKKLSKKADMQVFNLQKALFDAGYFGNTSFEKAADGFMGKKTRQAMAEAHKAGYRFNETTGKMEKIPIQQFKQSQGESAYANMYMNLFPYSYGSFVEEDGQYVPYDSTKHGNIMDRNFRIAGGHEEPASLLNAAVLNFKNAYKSKDPRRDVFDQLCDMDLSDPKNKQEFFTLAKKAHIPLYSKQDAQLSQQVMRARQDAMYMHAYGKQKYDTFTINPSYESRTAKSKKKPTYTYKDPKLRNTINGDLYNSWRRYGTNFTLDDGTLDEEFKSSQPTYSKTKDGKTVYRVPIMSSMGNIMLIADDAKGTNMRYYDKWDYLTDDWGVDPSSNEFYYGDDLAMGDTPIYRTATHGYNKRGYAETPSGLVGKAIEAKKEELQPKIEEAVSDAGDQAVSLVQKGVQKITPYIKRFF